MDGNRQYQIDLPVCRYTLVIPNSINNFEQHSCFIPVILSAFAAFLFFCLLFASSSRYVISYYCFLLYLYFQSILRQFPLIQILIRSATKTENIDSSGSWRLLLIWFTLLIASVTTFFLIGQKNYFSVLGSLSCSDSYVFCLPLFYQG